MSKTYKIGQVKALPWTISPEALRQEIAKRLNISMEELKKQELELIQTHRLSNLKKD